MADDDSGDREKTKASPLQVATAWVLGLAGLVAAISLLATNSEKLVEIFSPSKQPSGSSSGPASLAPSDRQPDPTVFSNGETIIRGTWSIDLDNGVTAMSGTDSDLFWEQETDTKRTLKPMNGALFALVGQRDFDSLKLQTLKGLNFLSSAIRADNNVSNAIPNGTVLAYRTKHGRYGKFLIENYAYDLKVKWLTFGP
jgi:hypothetical protein